MEQTMCRASRHVMNELNKCAEAAGVQGLIVPAHIYMCDYMVIKYQQAAVTNVIKSHIASIPPKRRESKHFTPMYWYKMVDNMLSGKQGVCRNEQGVYGEMTDYNGFSHITRMFLIDDYSVQDAKKINEIVNTSDLETIVEACKQSADAGVRNVAYMSAVINSIKANKAMRQADMDRLRTRVESSQTSLRTETHTHTAIELAQMEYEYNKKKEAAMLEALFNRIAGGDKKC